MSATMTDSQLKMLTNAIASIRADITHLTDALGAPILDGTPCILLLAGRNLDDSPCQQVYGNWPTATGMVRGYRHEQAVDSYMTHVVCMSPERAEEARKQLAVQQLEVTIGHKTTFQRQRLAELTELLAHLENSLPEPAAETTV